MLTIEFFSALVLCYMIGAVPTGVILTRGAGIGDIRQAGSGNIGATNVYRVAGRKLGILTLVGDALKGMVPMLIAVHIFELNEIKLALVALLLFVGHCYPVYLNFKGGKGVATGLGIYLVLSPLAVLGALLVFAGVLWTWRYISLASVIAAAAVPIFVYLHAGSLPLLLTATVISTLVVARHRANIERLRAGTESKFRP
ncbi:MAG: glycerol-3-phosphate acyltransferase [Desulfuromonadales bacterium]|nr:glycerol-3-phosphate acyltransferase [Desulfuromonadales bacterium]